VLSLVSPGYYYGIVTGLFGFTPELQAGKVSGLAGLGDPERLLRVMRQMIDFEDGKIRTRLGRYFKPWFVGADGLPELARALEGSRREDVAAAAQAQLEFVVTRYVERFLRETGMRNLALAGGVFANVKLNQRLRELDGVEGVYVHPNMGDGGLPLGAALHELCRTGGRFAKPLARADLGPAFDDDEVVAALVAKAIRYTRVPDGVVVALEALRRDRVVGWFAGRMEYGPRALCHRSILYHARDRSVNEWLNQRLERTEFMPFAPVTTAEIAGRCFSGWARDDLSSRLMTMTYDCSDAFKKDSPATVHVDGTARPQVVHADDNPTMHRLLTAWCEERRAMSLINTSFNHHEEPIVCTPADAAESLEKANVDVLVAGNIVAGDAGILHELGVLPG
jgi:carbamoyltransferase